jgi:hypothetical protein
MCVISVGGCLSSPQGQTRIPESAEFQSGHFPCSFIHFFMQSLWAVPPPVAFFSHDCCATVGTDIVARQSKADAQTSFDIIASVEVAICGPEYRCGLIRGNNKIRQGQRSPSERAFSGSSLATSAIRWNGPRTQRVGYFCRKFW